MTDPATVDRVHTLLGRCARPPRPADEVHPDHLLVEDLGIDSLAFIEALIGFENELGIQLDEEDLVLQPGSRVSTFTERVVRAVEAASGPT